MRSEQAHRKRSSGAFRLRTGGALKAFRQIFLSTLFAVAAPPAFAEVCDKLRPLWMPGTPTSAWDEMINLFASPPALILLFASILAVRFRSKWSALAATALWTVLVTRVVSWDPTSVTSLALAEGCVGPPTLFITAVAAICVAMILYTAPNRRKDSET